MPQAICVDMGTTSRSPTFSLSHCLGPVNDDETSPGASDAGYGGAGGTKGLRRTPHWLLLQQPRWPLASPRALHNGSLNASSRRTWLCIFSQS